MVAPRHPMVSSFVQLSQLGSWFSQTRGAVRNDQSQRRGVALLGHELRKVDTALVDARRCPRVEALHVEAQLLERRGQASAGKVPRPTGGHRDVADVDDSAEVGPGRENDRLGFVRNTEVRHHARHAARLRHQSFDALLLERQSRLVLEHLFHAGAVLPLVALRPHALHGASLGGVEQLDLRESPLGIQPHLTTQRVHFPHDLRLAGAADGGVARHPRDAVQRPRQHQNAQPARAAARAASHPACPAPTTMQSYCPPVRTAWSSVLISWFPSPCQLMIA